MAKSMEGGEAERRALARAAKKAGKKPSAVGATRGASKQRAKAKTSASHQKKVDQIRQGKQPVIKQGTPSARPGSRDADTPDRERHPRL